MVILIADEIDEFTDYRKSSICQQSGREHQSQNILNHVSLKRFILFIFAITSLITLPFLNTKGEENSTHWRHHQQAELRWQDYQKDGSIINPDSTAVTTDNSQDNIPPMVKWVMPTGMANFTNGVIMAQTDVDVDATSKLFPYLPYDSEGTNQVLKELQKDIAEARINAAGELRLDHPILEPELSYNQSQAILARNGRLARVRLFDTCLADRDVVDLYYGGQPWATVVLTKESVELFIPIDPVYPSNNLLEIIPVSEGESPGITLGIETSQGIGYVRTLTETDSPVELEIINPTLFLPTF